VKTNTKLVPSSAASINTPILHGAVPIGSDPCGLEPIHKVCDACLERSIAPWNQSQRCRSDPSNFGTDLLSLVVFHTIFFISNKVIFRIAWSNLFQYYENK